MDDAGVRDVVGGGAGGGGGGDGELDEGLRVVGEEVGDGAVGGGELAPVEAAGAGGVVVGGDAEFGEVEFVGLHEAVAVFVGPDVEFVFVVGEEGVFVFFGGGFADVADVGGGAVGAGVFVVEGALGFVGVSGVAGGVDVLGDGAGFDTLDHCAVNVTLITVSSIASSEYMYPLFTIILSTTLMATPSRSVNIQPLNL